MAEGRGGRTRKKEEQQVNRTVKTTLSGDDFAWLHSDYKRETIGQNVSFAEFIRQRLLAAKRAGEKANSRADALMIQMALAEMREELQGLTTGGNDHQEGVNSEVNHPEGSNKLQDNPQALGNLAFISQRLTVAIKEISIWLYGSSPEKI